MTSSDICCRTPSVSRRCVQFRPYLSRTHRSSRFNIAPALPLLALPLKRNDDMQSERLGLLPRSSTLRPGLDRVCISCIRGSRSGRGSRLAVRGRGCLVLGRRHCISLATCGRVVLLILGRSCDGRRHFVDLSFDRLALLQALVATVNIVAVQVLLLDHGCGADVWELIAREVESVFV